VIVVTSHNEVATIRRFQTLGAIGYVLKHARRQQFTADAGTELLDGVLACETDDEAG
jgi:DNA-binding NarL/FixJ family response regulator